MTKLDEFHTHEALDRTYLCCEMFDTYVAEHPYVKADPQLAELCEKATDALYAVYNAIGARHL